MTRQFWRTRQSTTRELKNEIEIGHFGKHSGGEKTTLGEP